MTHRYLSTTCITANLNNHVVAFIQRSYGGGHRGWWWTGQSVSLKALSRPDDNSRLRPSSYSLLFASRGANVVVNDFNAEAAQRVVDEIKHGAFRSMDLVSGLMYVTCGQREAVQSRTPRQRQMALLSYRPPSTRLGGLRSSSIMRAS